MRPIRFYDRIFEELICEPLPRTVDPIHQREIERTAPERTKHLREVARDAEVYEITNVANMVIDSEMDIEKEIHCLAPPFPKVWMEWELRRYAGVSVPARRMGVFFTYMGVRQFSDNRTHLDHEVLDELGTRLIDQGARWLLFVTDFLEFSAMPDMIVSPYRGSYSGSLLGLDEHGTPFDETCSVYHGAITRREAESIQSQRAIAFYALALLNCDNIESATTQPRGGLNKTRKKKGKKPLVRYHTIHVNPLKTPTVHKHSADGSPTGRKMPRHKRAGGIRDYTKGNGLFGKIHGRFYFGPHLVGSAKEGIVVSDYSVDPEEKTSGGA